MRDKASTRPILPMLRDRLFGLEDLSGWLGLREWSRLLDLAVARRSLPTDAPLITILLGPTGAGKSTVFNEILGRPVSPAGALRPCTTRPVAAAAPEVAKFLRRDPLLGEVGLEVFCDEELLGSLGRQALVDTPDFDSVVPENRRLCRMLLDRADRVVVVLSPEKYGDAAVWEALEVLRRLESAEGFVFNKSEGGEALADCTRLLGQAGFPEPFPVPRLAPSPETPSFGAEIRRTLRGLVTPAPQPSALLAERTASVERWEREVRREAVEPWVVSLHRALDRVEGELASRAEELPHRIRTRLPLGLDEALSRELQKRFLEKIQRYDFLREPRRWLGTPIRWLVRAFPFGGGFSSSHPAGPPSTAQWLTGVYRDRYLGFLLDVTADLRSVAQEASRATEPPLSWPHVPDLDPAAATAGLESALRGLQAQAERESARISENLSYAGKIGFFGSQLVFHVLLLTVLVKTGGGLSAGDLAAQGLLSPYVAKLSAHLVSSGEANAVRKRLEDYLCREIERRVRAMYAPLEHRLEELRQAVGTPFEWREAARRWDSGES